MAGLSVLTVLSLIVTVQCLHQGPSPLARLVFQDGFHTMLQQSAIRAAKVSKSLPITGKIVGKYRVLGARISYIGTFTGQKSQNTLKAKYGVSLRGAYRMIGWDGKINAGIQGNYLMRTYGKSFTAEMTGKFGLSFIGTFDGVKATMKSGGTIRAMASSSGKVHIQEKGNAVVVIGGKRATVEFVANVGLDSISSKVTGLYMGKRFALQIRARFDGLNDVIVIENSGSYEGTYGGKPFSGTFSVKGGKMIK